MRVVILGCGGSAGVPMLGGPSGTGDWGLCDPAEPRNRRTRSSIMVESDGGHRVLVDTGPELREQLLVNGIGWIDSIIYSHAHADHVAGLDEVRSLNRIVERPIDCYATQAVLDEIAHRFEYAFRPWSPPSFYRPVMVPVAIEPGQTTRIEGMDFHLFEQNHGRSETLGFRVGRFAYSTDVVRLEADALDRINGAECWVVDCFQRKQHPAHAHLDLVREWSDRLGIKRTILTHMGTDMDWAWMSAHLPAGFEAAFDGMQFQV